MARVDVLKIIRITTLTAKSLLKIKQLKKTLDANIPKQMSTDLKPFIQSLLNIKASTVALGAALAGFVSMIKTAFQGLALDLMAVKRMNNAIQAMGASSQLSAKNLWLYVSTLLVTLGLSAAGLGNVAAQFINLGITSLTQLKKYMLAAIGLSLQTGLAVLDVADKFVAALTGKLMGLKQLGVSADALKLKGKGMAEALLKGAQAFANIDTNTMSRTVAILRLNWSNMTKLIASHFAPSIVGVMQIITNHLNAIKNLIVSSAIFSSLKGVHKLYLSIKISIQQRLVALNLLISALLLHAARLLAISLLAKKYNLTLKLLLLTLNQTLLTMILQTAQKKLQALHADKLYMTLRAKYSLTQSGLALLKNANFYMILISIAATVILSNWDKIKLKLTGVNKLMKLLADLSARMIANLLKDFTSLIQQLKAYHNLQYKSKLQRLHYNNLIDHYNKNIAPKYNTSLLNLKSRIEDINIVIQQMSQNMLVLIKTRMKAAIILKSQDKFTKLALKMVLAQQKIDKLRGLNKSYLQGLDMFLLPPDATLKLIKLYQLKRKALLIQRDSTFERNKKAILKQQDIIANYRKQILDLMQKISNIAAVFEVPLINIKPGGGGGVSKLTLLTLKQLKDNYLEVAKARLLYIKVSGDLGLVLVESIRLHLSLNKRLALIKNLQLLLNNSIIELQKNEKLKLGSQLWIKQQNNIIESKLKVNSLLAERYNILKSIALLLGKTPLFVINMLRTYIKRDNSLRKLKLSKIQKLIETLQPIVEFKKLIGDLDLTSIARQNRLNYLLEKKKLLTLKYNESVLKLSNLKLDRVIDFKLLPGLVKDPLGTGNALRPLTDKLKWQILKYKMIGDLIKKSFLNITQSIPNAFSNMFDAVLFQGVKFKDALKQMLKDLLRQLVSASVFLLAKTGIGLLTGGVGFLSTPTGGISMPTAGSVASSVSQYSNRSIDRKLDKLIDVMLNFTPVQTQVIDLPTLGNASTIGNAMIINGI